MKKTMIGPVLNRELAIDSGTYCRPKLNKYTPRQFIASRFRISLKTTLETILTCRIPDMNLKPHIALDLLRHNPIANLLIFSICLIVLAI